MRLSVFLFYACLLFFCCLYLPLQAQPAGKDSLLTADAYTRALQVYHRTLAPETGLYRGSEFVQYYRLREGHPFFDSLMQQGSVFYDGVLYQGLPLSYDLVTAQVVINDPYENYKISLINDQIDYFTILHHLFINFSDSLRPSAPHSGFYEQLYKDRITLLKKERKLVMDDLSSGKVEKYIDYSVFYYLKKGETWYAVNNKRSLLHALDDRSKEVKKFIRRNGLSIRHDKENTLLRVAAWYNGEITGTVNK